MTTQPSTPSDQLLNTAAAAAPTLLNLKIRFSHSELPDLPLLLPSSFPSSPDHDAAAETSAATSSVNNLKARIRTSLPETWRKHGLKLIYGGRVLDGRDNILLALRLSLPGALQPPSTPSEPWRTGDSTARSPPNPADAGTGTDNTTTITTTSKGKARATPSKTPPVYIHCAITPTPLDARALQQQLALEAAPAPVPGAAAPAASSAPSSHAPQHHALPAPQPQGFDRLLAPASGFNPSDVAALRAQFRAIIGARYTPDTMPGAGTLLRMEEAWLDDSSSLPAGAAVAGSAAAAGRPSGGGSDAAGGGADSAEQGVAGGAGAGVGGYTDDDGAAALDDTLYGVFVGFFWPLGACVWGLREEGVWSRRRGWAVLAGILVNIAFGVVRVLS